MRVLTEGKPFTPAWVGLPIVCEKCGASYELEKGDEELVKKVEHAYGFFYAAKCLNCGHTAKTGTVPN